MALLQKPGFVVFCADHRQPDIPEYLGFSILFRANLSGFYPAGFQGGRLGQGKLDKVF